MKQELVTIRTSSGLRDTMFDVLDGVLNGKITPQAAQAATKAGVVIMGVTRLEIDHQRFVSAGLIPVSKKESKPKELVLGKK